MAAFQAYECYLVLDAGKMYANQLVNIKFGDANVGGALLADELNRVMKPPSCAD